MEYKLNFKAIAERTHVSAVARYLGLEVKKGRIPCPSCNKGGERAIELHEDTNSFRCHMAGVSGDSIALLAHIKDQRMLVSAKELDALKQAPVKQEKKPKKEGFDHVKYRETLNPNVDGLPLETLKRAGIGMSHKGTHQGFLAIPIYDKETHEFIEYWSVPPQTVRLPKTHREPVTGTKTAKLRLVN